jgi:hypothetical protein
MPQGAGKPNAFSERTKSGNCTLNRMKVGEKHENVSGFTATYSKVAVSIDRIIFRRLAYDHQPGTQAARDV